MNRNTILYRGWMITPSHSANAGNCVRWEQITGDQIHSAADQPSLTEAIDHAMEDIDRREDAKAGKVRAK